MKITENFERQIVSNFIVILWITVWLIPLKFNLGINLAFEFILIWLLFLFLSLKSISLNQIIIILITTIVVFFDYARSNNLRTFIYLAFTLTSISIYKIVYFSKPCLKKWHIKLFLVIPLASLFLRFFMPEVFVLSEDDTLYIGSEQIRRINLLGYESNSLACMINLLIVLVLNTNIIKSIFLRYLYLIILIGIVILTFSRSGLISLLLIFLFSFFYLQKTNKFILFISIFFVISVFTILAFDYWILLTDRITNLNYINDGRWEVLKDRLHDIMRSEISFLFGVGFMSTNVTDNSILAMLHGYGVMGTALLVLIIFFCFLNKKKDRLPLNVKLLLFIPIFLYAITADIFGQAKLIATFAVILYIFQYYSFSIYKKFYS